MAKKKGNKTDLESMILYGVLAVVVIALGFSAYTFFGQQKEGGGNTGSVQNSGMVTSPYRAIATGDTDSGNVLIELTPRKPANGKLLVDFAANTHSVALGQYDLRKIATLEYNGKTAYPVSAPVLSGHHVSGTLEFNAEGKMASFTIRIKGIPKVEERVFAWD